MEAHVCTLVAVTQIRESNHGSITLRIARCCLEALFWKYFLAHRKRCIFLILFQTFVRCQTGETSTNFQNPRKTRCRKCHRRLWTIRDAGGKIRHDDRWQSAVTQSRSSRERPHPLNHIWVSRVDQWLLIRHVELWSFCSAATDCRRCEIRCRGVSFLFTEGKRLVMTLSDWINPDV